MPSNCATKKRRGGGLLNSFRAGDGGIFQPFSGDMASKARKGARLEVVGASRRWKRPKIQPHSEVLQVS